MSTLSPELAAKVLNLIAVSNEIFKRHEEERSKTAQYESIAQELAPKIARRLVEQDIIDKDSETKLVDTLKKSASSAIELLHDVIKAVSTPRSNYPYQTLGAPYQPTTPSVSRYSDIPPEMVEGFVINVQNLR